MREVKARGRAALQNAPMDETWDTVVIGSGLGGLTAAALLARAGLRVLVLEQNDRPGGAAQTYARAGRRIEASLHETTPPEADPDPKAEVLASARAGFGGYTGAMGCGAMAARHVLRAQ